MSLIPTIYSSTDPGAPQLTGQVGSLVSLLRALLVTGYGTSPNAKPGLGWTEEFTGTNKAAFRNAPVTGTGYRLRVDDSNAMYGLMRAYETMTDIDNGSGPTPLTSVLANGVIWPKSGTANSTARAWWAIGTERCFYLFVDTQALGLVFASPYFAGDIISLRPGDAHHFMLEAIMSTSYGGSSGLVHSNLFYGVGAGWNTAPASSTLCGFLGRNYGQVPGSVYAGHPTLETGINAYGGNGASYPFPVNNGLLYSKALVMEGAYLPRGFMPGVLVPLHPTPFGDLTEVPDVSGLPMGTVLVAKGFRSVSPVTLAYTGQVLFDKSNAW